MAWFGWIERARVRLGVRSANLAQALHERRQPPDPGNFRAALDAFTRQAESLRADTLVQDLPGSTFGQIFALGFAFDQFRKNLSDLLARTEELALRRTTETSGG